MIKSLIAIICFSCPLGLLAQIILKGTLQHETKGAGGVSVLAHPIGQKNAIMAFAISKSDGGFQIELNSTLDSLEITATSLSYADATIKIKNESQNLSLELTPEVRNIKEVIVKADPIRLKKDTITYQVGAFAREGDRSIGDVIKKLPGFEVSVNGAIKYQGEPIEKYYIEGLDLLEGKYGLANKNLPHKAVKSVEVLENHQPIKMLDSLMFSNKTSLNIRLKKDIALTGSGKLGVGFSPFLWEVSLTPMLFSKKQQSIASYQSNNIGDDVSSQLIPHYFDEMKGESKENLVGIRTLSTPPIREERYLDNNIHLLTYNHLLKIDEDSELKINTSYLNDYQQQRGNIQSLYFLSNDTISTLESTQNRFFWNNLKTDFIFSQNANKRFIKNKLSVRKHWDQADGQVENDSTKVLQEIKTPYFSIDNHLKWVQPLKRNFLTFKSAVSYDKSPQQLRVTPGVFASALNAGILYENTSQQITLGDFNTQNSLSFTFSRKSWRFDSEAEIEYQKQSFDSFLQKDQIRLNPDSLENQMEWEYFSPSFTETFRYETANLNLSFKIPIKGVHYKIEDRNINMQQSVNKLLVNPYFYLNYKINGYLTSNFSMGFTQNFGNIRDIHYGYLLYNYRSLLRKNLPLQESTRYYYQVLLKYRNPISSWFASVSLNQSRTTRNILTNQLIQPDGSLTTNALLQDNDSEQTNINLNVSKLIPDARTTFFLKINYGQSKSENLSNGALTAINTQNLFVEPKVNFNYLEWMSLDYTYQYMSLNQKVSGSSLEVKTQNHLLTIGLFPFPRHSLGIDLESYRNTLSNQNNHNYFANIHYRWKPKGTRLTFETKCYNLLGTEEIISYYASDISTVENRFQIRPRQILFSLSFSLSK